MIFQKVKLVKYSAFLFFITLVPYAQANDNDPLDRDLYEQGRNQYENRPWNDSRASYPQYYYLQNRDVSAIDRQIQAEKLGRIRATAFQNHQGYPVTLRDILNVAIQYGMLRDQSKPAYSQIPRLDLTYISDIFGQNDLQRFAHSLYYQMDEISNQMAKAVYDSLVRNNEDGGKGAKEFVRYVLGDTSRGEYGDFPNSTKKWDGTDPLSKLIKEKFMTSYPSVFTDGNNKSYQGPFASYLQVLFERGQLSNKQTNALIRNFQTLATKLSTTKNNLAAHIVGESIKNDFTNYGVAEYQTNKRSMATACMRFYGR